MGEVGRCGWFGVVGHVRHWGLAVTMVSPKSAIRSIPLLFAGARPADVGSVVRSIMSSAVRDQCPPLNVAESLRRGPGYAEAGGDQTLYEVSAR